jgi:hypothetical protein
MVRSQQTVPSPPGLCPRTNSLPRMLQNLDRQKIKGLLPDR